LSPDGKRIAWVAENGDNKTVKVWDAHTGVELAALRGHADRVECVAYSPDGRRIVTGSYDSTVRVWDAHTGDNLAVLSAHQHSLVRYSLDGRRIVIAGNAGGDVVVLDAATYACLVKFHRQAGQVNVDEIAAGATEPRSSFVQGLETKIRDSTTVEFARFPIALEHIIRHPSARQWAGSVGNHVYLITLEGQAPLRREPALPSGRGYCHRCGKCLPIDHGNKPCPMCQACCECVGVRTCFICDGCNSYVPVDWQFCILCGARTGA
jgi:hypothetical protein